MIKNKLTKKALIFTVFTLGFANAAIAQVPMKMNNATFQLREGNMPPPHAVGDVPPPPPPKEGKVPPPPPAIGDVPPPPPPKEGKVPPPPPIK